MQVKAKTGQVCCKMADFEAVQIRSPLFWDTTLHYWVIDTWHFEGTKLFGNMEHQSYGEGSQYNGTTKTLNLVHRTVRYKNSKTLYNVQNNSYVYCNKHNFFYFYNFTVDSVVYLITHTNTCTYILLKKSKIYIKTFKTLLHVSIKRSSSGSIYCSLLKL